MAKASGERTGRCGEREAPAEPPGTHEPRRIGEGLGVGNILERCLRPCFRHGHCHWHGLGNGGKSPMIAAFTGDLFPGDSIGRILSMQSIGYGIGGALGAYIGGYFYDHTGSYIVPFVLLLTSTGLSVVAIWMAAPHHWRTFRKETFVTPGMDRE